MSSRATPGVPRAGQRVAIVGTGISGLTVAHRLQRDFDVTLFESGDYVGGHTNTIDVVYDDVQYAIDTGFIVFNEWTYPNFITLLDELGVASQESSMGFSVKCPATGVEYCGTSMDSIFAQRRNALRPSFLWMLREILRFNRQAPRLLETPDDAMTLGEFLDRGRYSKRFVDHFIIPMGAAIWSACPAAMRDIPARFFIRFFANHGMLSVDDRPMWRVVSGGSREYVRAITAPFGDRIRLNTAVRAVQRRDDEVALELADGSREVFDSVVLATHSDTALRLLAEPSPQEQAILSSMPYQENEATLHVDESVLPRSPRAWAAWNYHVPTEPRDRVAVTYNMNILQRLRAPDGVELPVQFCVTLNDDAAIDADKVLQRIRYHHPIFSTQSIAAQARHGEISGRHRTFYCGAYWGNGFHEDGVTSGLKVAQQVRDGSLIVR
jgi:predicted NAD/FAD-binding protein